MRSRLVFLVLAGVCFFLWHSPLLSEAGRVRGFNSDAAIIALMGKKMLDGRGFDIFFWGQNYVGPLSSIFIAAAGAFLGGVTALAMRIGVFVEVFLGIAIVGWTVGRVDRRAAAVTTAMLVATPPVILRMMITPLGAEMAFLMAAAVAALVVQQLTAPDGRGWLARTAGQVAFGVVIGIAWWMNQQVVFTLLAAAWVLGSRSTIGSAVLRRVRPVDRLLLRGDRLGWRAMPGVVEALVTVITSAGALLLLLFVVMQLGGFGSIPFILGPVLDPVALVVIPHLLLPLILGEWRQWRAPRGASEWSETRALALVAAGFVVGYAPVLLGAILGWYERTYVFAFAPSYPRDVLEQARTLWREVLPHTLGVASPVAALWVAGFTLFVAAAVARIRHSPVRLFFAVAALANLLFFLVTRGGKPHYFISTVAMLLALAALGACDLWDRRRMAWRVLAAAGVACGLASIALSAHAWHRQTLAEPDPLPLLARVEEARCAVTYADFWIAYRYRLLDGERRAWVPYQSQNRTRAESIAAQRLPGQRCLVTKSGAVEKLDGDLPLQWDPRGGKSAINPPERPSV